MQVRKRLRNWVFNLVRKDIALLLQEHEQALLVVFREELARLDNEIPEEKLFIDIKMVPLGEVIIKSALQALTCFLVEPPDIDKYPFRETQS